MSSAAIIPHMSHLGGGGGGGGDDRGGGEGRGAMVFFCTPEDIGGSLCIGPRSSCQSFSAL